MKETTKMATKSTTQTSNSNYEQMQFNDIDESFPRVDDLDVTVTLEEPILVELESDFDNLMMP